VSDSERPDLAALQELEQLIGALGDEMAAWRRRAHEAEARLKTMEPRNSGDGGGRGGAGGTGGEKSASSSAAVTALEKENRELRRRLEAAKLRTSQLLERLRFLRQQHGQGAER
jgi:hypothetical protein